MNKQELFWQGEFGTNYHKRNRTTDRRMFWGEVLASRCAHIKSVLEPGAGKGENLIALRSMLGCKNGLIGVEVNPNACNVMRDNGLDVIESNFLGCWPCRVFDLVLTRGFLIHVPLDDLDNTLHRIYFAASRYICFVEYFSVERREISYRGNAEALWSDDFAARIMRLHPDLFLVKYGFRYHTEGGDDLTYFLMEKKT